MEINKINRSAINSYNTIKKAKAADSSKKVSGADGKFDSVEIDFSQSLESAKANIASRLAAEANIEKIKQLQAEYAGGGFSVSTDEIAKAVLGE